MLNSTFFSISSTWWCMFCDFRWLLFRLAPLHYCYSLFLGREVILIVFDIFFLCFLLLTEIGIFYIELSVVSTLYIVQSIFSNLINMEGFKFFLLLFEVWILREDSPCSSNPLYLWEHSHLTVMFFNRFWILLLFDRLFSLLLYLYPFYRHALVEFRAYLLCSVL